MSPVDASLFEADMKRVQERRKDGMRMGSQVPQIERIPLKSPVLMRITEGGIPLGRVSRLWGPPSSGKSYLSLLIIAAAQKYRSKQFKSGLGCTYWNIEGVWDAAYSESLGIDVKKVGLEEADVIEDIAVELEILLRSCHLHVIDSASSAKATDELAVADENDWLPMIENRAWKRAWRRIEANFDKQENVIILIDHMTTDYKTKARKALGGKVLAHASSMSIECSSGGWLFYNKDGLLVKADKIKNELGINPSGVLEPDGAEINVRVTKSRVCRPFREGKLHLDFHTLQLDTTFELFEGAKFFDVDGTPAARSAKPAIAQQTGAKSAWYELPSGDKVQGELAIRKRIEEDVQLASLIRKAMLAGW